MQQNVKLDDIIEVDIKRMGINGEGIGYHERLAIFIDQALPGETVKVQIKEVFPNRATAKVVETLKKSKQRIIPFCPVYDLCGGCQVQHFNYVAMLGQKKDILSKALDRYMKKYDKSLIKETIGMDNPMHYRNKASLPLRKINGKNRFGMYARNSNQFIPIEDCGIQHKKINEIFTTITLLMDKLGIDAYDPKTKKGDISHAVVRITENLEEVQVSFIIPKKVNKMIEFVNELVVHHPEILSVYDVINSEVKQSFFTNKTKLIYGKETVDESLSGFKFSLKPDAFFQLNTTQADKFYKKMVELSEVSENDIVIDAYAGSAPISHYIADKAKKVYAIEINKDAATSAKISLNNNNIRNVEVIQSDFEEALNKLKNQTIDIMLFDPPRSGLGESTIDTILKFKPKRLVYGSCNPSTLAKDLSQLSKSYIVKEIIPIDMFPYTSLVESVSLLILK
ncbi:23S rRNA (uracil(1939)-C(5))-methyltransferase RlmD [Acholeplasma granularum]|uniref:23S rRNA (uracil(1939)-C(5))-methyltransferase RlmD n=1 Tax=Acholeplasma granularum TaxID=264635 RepID=UPI0004728E22|nr:23S rRNA (uracil(1939)-C(5))-methyltransferase RlmD [Acholeplasma granularum]